MSSMHRQIEALAPWFHNLHLPSGEQTAPEHPLGDFPAFKWRDISPHVQADLTGLEVLDVGCNAGFHSFELARRGASVLAIDHDPHCIAQATWAAKLLDPHRRVRLEVMQVYDLARLSQRFDLVLFMGVFYHLRYPLLALDMVVRCMRGQLIFQTLTKPSPAEASDTPEDVPWHERARLAQADWPSVAFIEHSYAGDPTNWWAPSPAAAEAMLRSAGLRVLARPDEETWICERTQGVMDEWVQRELDAVTGNTP